MGSSLSSLGLKTITHPIFSLKAESMSYSFLYPQCYLMLNKFVLFLVIIVEEHIQIQGCNIAVTKAMELVNVKNSSIRTLKSESSATKVLSYFFTSISL